MTFFLSRANLILLLFLLRLVVVVVVVVVLDQTIAIDIAYFASAWIVLPSR